MSKEDSEAQILGSVVVREGRIRDYRELVNVICAIAKRKEGSSEDISVKEIVFCPKTRVYVALYEVPASNRRMSPRSRSKGERGSMV